MYVTRYETPETNVSYALWNDDEYPSAVGMPGEVGNSEFTFSIRQVDDEEAAAAVWSAT